MSQLSLFELEEDKPITTIEIDLWNGKSKRIVNGAWVEPIICPVCHFSYQNPVIFEMNCGINVPAAPLGVCFGLWWKEYRFGNEKVA